MKASAFGYTKANDLAHALALLTEHGPTAQVLAGGQSLLPMMNLRLAAPEWLIDINGLSDLADISDAGDAIRIGAMTRHRTLQTDPLVAKHVPLLAQAVPYVAHAAIRNRGTMGGSLALADPAAEYPAVALAWGATVVLASASGERRVAAKDFFVDLYQTARQPHELLVAVEFAKTRPTQRSAFTELAQRHGDYAMAGLALTLQVKANIASEVRVVPLALGSKPELLAPVMACLEGQALTAARVQAAQAAIDEAGEAQGDTHANAATKRHLTRVLLGRALQQVMETA